MRPDVAKALERLLAAGGGIVTATAWRESGLPPVALSRLAGPGGRWQRVHPGVYVTHRGSLSDDERRRAAFAYVGPGAVLSGAGALTGLSIFDNRLPERLLFLVDDAKTRKSLETVEIERTRRLPEVDGEFPVAPVARAITDQCRRERDPDRIRFLVGLAVQRRQATVEELLLELSRAPRSGTGLLRDALGGAAAGVRGAEEDRLRRFFVSRGMREPAWNVHLYDEEERWVAYVDGFLDGIYFETQSRRWHLFADGKWEKDLSRMSRLSSYGAVPILASNAQMRGHPDELEASIRRAQMRAVGQGCRLRVGPPPAWWGERAA